MVILSTALVTSMLNRCEDDHLHDQHADVSTVASKYHDKLRAKCLELVFESDYKESF